MCVIYKSIYNNFLMYNMSLSHLIEIHYKTARIKN